MEKRSRCKRYTAGAFFVSFMILAGSLFVCENTVVSGSVTSGNGSSPAAVADLQSGTGDDDSSASFFSGKGSAAEKGTINKNENEVFSLDPTVVYREGEETVLDTKKLSVIATGYDTACEISYIGSEKIPGFAMKMRLENKTDDDLDVEYFYSTVNRFGVEEPIFHETGGKEQSYLIHIPAGESINAQLDYPVSTLTGAGIRSVDEIRCAFKNGITDELLGTIEAYPTGKKPEEIVQADPITAEDINILVDNDMFTFGIIKDADKAASMLWPISEGEDNRVFFYAFNKTKTPVVFTIFEAFADGLPYYFYGIYEDENGKEIREKEVMSRDESYNSEQIFACMPKCSSVGWFWIDQDFLKDNNYVSPADISEFSIGLGAESSGKAIYTGTLAFRPSDGSPTVTDLQKDGNSDKEDTEQSAYRSVEYVKTKDVVFENDAFKITAVKYDPAYVNPETWKEVFMAYLEIKNKTKKEYRFSNYYSSAAVNRLAGFPAEGPNQYKIAGGEKKAFRLFIDSTDFSKYGIQSVDEIRFTVSAVSSEYIEISDAFYKNTDNAELEQKRRELDKTDRFVEFCTLFPTGKKEEEIVAAVTLDDPSRFEQIGPYKLSFKKNKKGEVYTDGLELWFFNDSPDRELSLFIETVAVNGFVVKPVKSDSNGDDGNQKYYENDNKYNYHLENVPPLCVGHKRANYSSGPEILFLPEDVLRENGINKDGTISLSFELSINEGSGKEGSSSWEKVFNIPVNIKFSKTGTTGQ